MLGQWWVDDPEPGELVVELPELFELPELLELPVVVVPVEPVAAVVTPVLDVDVEVDIDAPDTAMPMPRLSPSVPAPTPMARRGRLSFIGSPFVSRHCLGGSRWTRPARNHRLHWTKRR